MTDAEFLDQAEQLLEDIEDLCDRINDEEPLDIDNQRVGSMVTLVFPNASQIVVNLQKPLHEVWLASRSGGYHFKCIDGAWMDTKGQGEFWAQLIADMNAQTGLNLKAPGH
jgi:CyaY protein